MNSALDVLKGLSDAKFTFTCCLNINVCWQCVHIYDKNLPSGRLAAIDDGDGGYTVVKPQHR